MPLRMRNRNLLLTERPFEGELGAKLYVGVGAPEHILYRPARAFNPLHPPLVIDTTRDVSVATTNTPPLEYTLPAELVGQDVWYQVRTFANDYENDTIYRPRQLLTDEGGDGEDRIVGTAKVVGLEKRDGGGLRVLFAYTMSRDGLQPETFSVVKVTGPGTVAIAQVTAKTDQRDYAIDVEDLADATAYTFDLVGHSGAIDTVLVSGFEFTADAEGPGTITGLVAEEY